MRRRLGFEVNLKYQPKEAARLAQIVESLRARTGHNFAVLSSVGCPEFQLLPHPFHGQTDHIAERAGNFRDNLVAVLLNRIGAGLVEQIHPGNVILDLPGSKRMEGHVGAHGKKPLTASAQMNQAYAGDDLMRLSLQARQHPFGFGEVCRLAEDFTAEKDQRVRAQHERVGDFPGHGAGLAMGVKLAKLKRRQLFVNNLRCVTGDDLKLRLQLPQQFRSAR